MNCLNSVLIIDDDPILRAISQSYFAAIGTQSIFVAGNGRQALQVVSDQAGSIDFILCDLNMPELDGVELLRHLKECGYRGAIGIVSGEDMSVIETARDLAKSYNLNIAGTVQKPLDKSTFDALIARASRRLDDLAGKPVFEVTAAKLSAAISAGQIIPHYQPKIALRTGAICSVEALARWQHPTAGLVGPDLFIPYAELNGLIGAITDCIVRQVIGDAVQWSNAGIKIRFAINIAPDALEKRDFPDRLERQIADAGLEPKRFTFEITERSELQKSPLAMEVVARLRLKGFDISIDDFGTGSANIDQLRNFPYSELKIDRSFVQGAKDDRFARACLKASAVFARELSMRLVAEGVSNQAEWELVAEENVDEVQGFLIARPMPAAEFADWFAKHNGTIPINLITGRDDASDDATGTKSLDALLKRAAG